MITPFLLIVAFMVLVLAVMTIRAMLTPRVGPPGSLDGSRLEAYAGVEQKLSALVRMPTVSRFDASEEDGSAFEHLIDAVPDLFPLVRDRLLRVEAGDRALVYEWPGSDPSVAPVILTAHFDVVPAGDESLWHRPPFSGDIADGYVHGRGTQDVKIMMVCALEAAERLLKSGYVPKRTIWFAFGGDEEIGGERGAASIAAMLKARGVRASFLLDEGGFVSQGMLSFADRPLALVGVAEKGYVDVAITASGAGGHASMPPRHTAAGLVSRAVALCEARPFPARITATLARFLANLSPYTPFAYRLLFRNLGLTAPLVKAAFSMSPTTNALIRTSQAATMLSGSDKENVLPEKSRAIINVRVLPGDTVAAAVARLDTIAARAGAKAGYAHVGHAVEPLPEAPVDHEGYRAIDSCIHEVFPEAGVVPFMFTAGTDTKHYIDVAEALYRFEPVTQAPADLACIHAANERISVDNVRRCCLFYETLMRRL